MRIYQLVEALRVLQTWSPEGDSPAFEQLLKTIEYNVKVGQYDDNDKLIEFV
jgi:DNA-binding transcriptional regulator YhcF (GntR family)